jgi:hypothetical protein
MQKRFRWMKATAPGGRLRWWVNLLAWWPNQPSPRGHRDRVFC